MISEPHLLSPKKVMEDALFVTVLFGQPLSLVCVMNVTPVQIKVVASFAEDRVSQMHTTVKDAPRWKKIEMVVRRSST